MSDFTAIVAMLAAFSLETIAVCALARHMYKRCDDILAGSVNGVPMRAKSRWLFFFHDYIALSFGLTMLLGVGGIGFFVASRTVGESARIVAYSCALVSGGFSLFNLMLGINWMVYFVSVLRQSEAN